jgi:geranylgeranyl diphosphate synthase, type II
MTTVSSDLRTWLEIRRRDVDRALELFLPSSPEAPAAVCNAMRYSVVAGGKRLRPMLVLASAEAVAEQAHAGDRNRPEPGPVTQLALPAACAVELIHTYSLVHDDLPAMDNDTLRRGRPTAHVVFGEGMAILSGDGLLTEAFALLAREPARSPIVSASELAARKLGALAVLAEAAGAKGMVGGQAVDLAATAPGAAPLDGDALRRMHARKTGALIRGSAAAGAIMAGATPQERSAIDAYAEALGLAFQIVDDILDVEGASASLGKTAGKDAAAGKPTYPALFGLAESRRLAYECADRALAALRTAGLNGQLPAIVRWVIARSN